MSERRARRRRKGIKTSAERYREELRVCMATNDMLAEELKVHRATVRRLRAWIEHHRAAEQQRRRTELEGQKEVSGG